MIFMPQIRPITDLRNTTEISNICHNTKEPVFITKNGYGDLVIMSIETYEKQFAMSELYQKLTLAEKQVAEKLPLLKGEDVFKKLRAKYGNKI